MKNCKKLLACLLAGVMMLAMLTACNGAGQSLGLNRATEANTRELCKTLGVAYDEELSTRAYTIANWIASSSVSCKVTQTRIERAGTADDIVKTDLKQERYASAFEAMGMGTLGANDFVPGFAIDCELDYPGTDISFTIPADGTVPAYMTSAAKGKTKLGAAYIVANNVNYVVVIFA